MTNKILVFLVVVIVLTVGASVTVVVKAERDKADHALALADEYRGNLVVSEATNEQIQTQLGLTRESLDQTQDALQTEVSHVQTVQTTAHELKRTCRHVGRFTHSLMQTVRVQARAVSKLLDNKRKRARALLHSVTHHLKHTQHTLERSGHARIHDMLEACSGDR